jgi:hypothetical protein
MEEALAGMICPCCGKAADFVAHRCIGRNSGTGEPFDQSWLTCEHCGAVVMADELIDGEKDIING